MYRQCSVVFCRRRGKRGKDIRGLARQTGGEGLDALWLKWPLETDSSHVVDMLLLYSMAYADI